MSQFADRLKAVKGLRDAFVTSVTTGTGSTSASAGVTFTVQVTTTKDALNTRFSGKAGK